MAVPLFTIVGAFAIYTLVEVAVFQPLPAANSTAPGDGQPNESAERRLLNATSAGVNSKQEVSVDTGFYVPASTLRLWAEAGVLEGCGQEEVCLPRQFLRT